MVLYFISLLKCFTALQDFISAKARGEQITSHWGMSILFILILMQPSLFAPLFYTKRLCNAKCTHRIQCSGWSPMGKQGLYPGLWFSLFLRLCSVWKHWDASVSSGQKFTHVTYCSAFNWEGFKPGVATSGRGTTALQSHAKTFRPNSKPVGFEKQEHNFHIFNQHKKKMCRAYALLASIKLAE